MDMGGAWRPLSALRPQVGARVSTALWALFGRWSVLPVVWGLSPWWIRPGSLQDVVCSRCPALAGRRGLCF